MKAYLRPRNHTFLNNTIGVHAHSISLFQEEKLINIFELLMNQNSISIAEPVEIQIDELGNNGFTMYGFVGDINDNKVPGLESILNYINDSFFAKNEGAVNQHNYNTTKDNYFQDFATYISNKINESKTYNIKNHRYTDNHSYNKKQNVTNNITNNVNERHNIWTNENVWNFKKDHTTDNYYGINNPRVYFNGNHLYKNMIIKLQLTMVI